MHSRMLSRNLDLSFRPRYHKPVCKWLRHFSLATALVFAWTLVLALPVQALTHPTKPKRTGVRILTPQQMHKIMGSQAPPPQPLGKPPLPPAPGATLPWNPPFPPAHPPTFDITVNFNTSSSSTGDGIMGPLPETINPATGNKLTQVPLFSWVARGGMPIGLHLYHSSQSTRNKELGYNWILSFDITASVNGTNGNVTITWGNETNELFVKNMDGSYSAPTGFHDTLVKNGDGTYTLTSKEQLQYHFNTSLLCNTITDENGNQVSISWNASNNVSSVTDPTNRILSISYTSGRISTITDPLNRQFGISYDGSGNLQTISYPAVNGNTYTRVFTYNSAHQITDMKTPRGYHWTYGYDTNGNFSSEKDPAGNQSSVVYGTSNGEVWTDPNSHTWSCAFDTSGRINQVTDALSDHANFTWDTSNNCTEVTDKRGYNWQFSYDSNGNILTAKDPYLNTTTLTWNSHNKLLTLEQPTEEKVTHTYDGNDNLTGTSWQDSSGVTQASVSYTVNSYGLTTDYYDANNHHYQYGYSTNGDITSQTTPLNHETQWVYDALGFCTSRTDAMSRQTTYTPDAWERLVTVTYPDTSTHTFQYDADSDLTQFVDATGTTTRSYDNCDRMTSESKGGSTVVSYSYDATGKKGLLSSITDSNSRVLTLLYTSRNQLYQLSETAGTATYSYDANGEETGVTDQNGATITESYDNASRLTGVTNKNSSGTVLSSFSYTLDTDSRRSAVSEADGSSVSYGYDWGNRLISETRTGTNPYSISYTLDGVGNRTGQTVGSTSTSFTLDNDDELNSTSGGISNSYGYNANGEQTGRTLAGVAYSLSFDYDGQLTSITQGSNTTSLSYDALGRRLSRTSGGTTTNFQYAGVAVLLELQGGTATATYTYGNALLRKDGEYPLFDGQGSERTVTNSSQTVAATANYDGFGNTVGTTGSSTDPYMFAATSRYRNDGDAGLMQVGARYYDAQVGRFITRDTLLTQLPYVYCGGSPVNWIDPTGHRVSEISPYDMAMMGWGIVGAGLAGEGLGIAGLAVGLPWYYAAGAVGASATDIALGGWGLGLCIGGGIALGGGLIAIGVGGYFLGKAVGWW